MRFLIRLFYVKSQRLFRKFFKTKQTVGREGGLVTYSDMGISSKIIVDTIYGKSIVIQRPCLSSEQLQ